MKCPCCNSEMEIQVHCNVGIDRCPDCGGVWLDRGELEKIADYVRDHTETMMPPPEKTTRKPALLKLLHSLL